MAGMMSIMTLFIVELSPVNAQSPQAFKYQAVARTSGGEPLQNQSVAFRITILKDSPSGTVVYKERHVTATNDFGLANLEIGNGTVISGNFSSISWPTSSMYIKTEIDPSGGYSYTDLGTTQLQSVPYALHSQTSSNTLNDLNWVRSGSDINNTNSGSVGIGSVTPKGKLDILQYTGGTSGSLVSTYNHQLVLGGPYNSGPNGTGVKLWIGDYNNDGTDVYPIYCEDENNKVDFWLKSRTNETTSLPILFFDGELGIGTTNPLYSRLHIQGNSTYSSIIRLNNTGTNGADFFMGSTSDLWGIGGNKFVMGHGTPQGGNVRFVLNDLGNIGIGTANPEGILHMNSTADATMLVEADSDNSGEEDNPRIELRQDGKQVTGSLGLIGSNGSIYSGSLANALYLMHESASPMQFGTNNTTRMTLSSAGQFGIGTENPVGRLTVEAESGQNIAQPSVEKGYVLKDGDFNTGNDFEIQERGGTIKFVVTDAGRVGIGKSAPGSPLEVSGSGTSAGLRVRYSDTYPDLFGEFKHGQAAGLIINSEAGGGVWADMSFQTNAATRMYIENTGNVGIGTTTPEGFVHLSSNSDAALIVESDADNSGEEDNPRIELRQDGKAVVGALGITGSGGTFYEGSYANSLYLMNEYGTPLLFGTDSTIKMTLTAAGRLGIGVTQPDAGLHVKGTEFPGSFLFLQSNTSKDAGIRLYEGTSAKWHLYNNAGLNGFMITNENGNIPFFAKDGNGYVGIGTTSPTHLLSVNGSIRSKEVIVNTGWSDFVFDDDYKLMSLKHLEEFIIDNGHLPEIPSAKDVEANGISLGTMDAKLLQKIEELTLYIIELQKQIDALQSNR